MSNAAPMRDDDLRDEGINAQPLCRASIHAAPRLEGCQAPPLFTRPKTSLFHQPTS